jgi:hypothetical protein
MVHLQHYIDECVKKHRERTICPVTGTTIAKAHNYERKYLNTDIKNSIQLPVESMITRVQKDSLVWFKGNYYQIPEGFTGKKVRCINTGTTIEIYHEGTLLETYTYEAGVKGMVRMSAKAAASARKPMSGLVRNWWLEVSERQMDYYHEIAGAVK